MRSSAKRSRIPYPTLPGLVSLLVASAALAGCGGDPAAPAAGGAATPTPAPTAAAALRPSGPDPLLAGEPPARPPTPTRSASATPSAAVKSARPRSSPTVEAGTTSPAGTGRYVFPVGGRNVSYHPTHSEYPATDIFAACGAPVVAVTDGTVLEVSRVDRYSKTGPQGPLNGGLLVSMLGADGVRYYGSHLSVLNTGIEPGVRVRAGQRLGSVGKTGNANNVCHLHFAISPPCARTGDWQIRRGVVWPAPYLDSWRQGGRRSPVDKVTAWERQNNCTA